MKLTNKDNESAAPAAALNNPSAGSPCEAEHSEIWIKAGSFLELLQIPNPGVGIWSFSLQEMLESSGTNAPFRLTESPEDGGCINLEFAFHLARKASRNLIGSMVRIAIDEARFGPNNRNSDYATAQLKLINFMFLDDAKSEWVVAELLHEFLEISECFDCWIARLSQAHWMVHDRDYEAWDYEDWEENDMYSGQRIPHEAQKDGLTFSLDFATKIALAAPTRRGALLRMLIGDLHNC